jgi:hypothetical protein
MPAMSKKVLSKNVTNTKYISIRTLNIRNFIPRTETTIKAVDVSSSIGHGYVVSNPTEVQKTCNLKYQAYYLTYDKSDKPHLYCDTNHSNKQDFIISNDWLIDKKTNDKLFEVKIDGGNIKIMKSGLPSMIYGDGRYWGMGQVPKVDDSRVRNIYFDPQDMPLMTHPTTHKKHTGYIEIQELKMADAI